jgi:hypothetical protein
MNRLSRQDISQVYHEGEEAVVALVESLYDIIISLEARIRRRLRRFRRGDISWRLWLRSCRARTLLSYSLSVNKTTQLFSVFLPLGIERSQNAVRFDFAQRTIFNNPIAQKGIAFENKTSCAHF